MADLNYGDVKRAVQDSVRQMQNDVQRLTNSLGVLTQQADRIDDIELLVRELQRTLYALQSTVSVLRRTEVSGIDPRLSQMAADIQDLKQRFAVIEKFAAQMSAYVQAKYEQDMDDRQYRTA